MELFWQNGQVVMQSQNHRPLRKPPPARNSDDATPSSARDIRPEEENHNQYLFMQEGEMASWLHYPIDDDVPPPLDQSFCADFLYPSPLPPTVNNNNSAMQTPARTSQLTELRHPSTSAAPPRPPIPPPRRHEQATPNFAYFSRHNSVRAKPGPSSVPRTTARESTVVDSCDTPAAPPPQAVSETARSSAEPTEGAGGVAGPSTTFDEPGGSSSSGEPVQKAAEEDRKRKGREAEEWDWQSEVSAELTQRCLFLCHITFTVYSYSFPYASRWHRLSCAG